MDTVGIHSAAEGTQERGEAGLPQGLHMGWCVYGFFLGCWGHGGSALPASYVECQLVLVPPNVP